VSDQFYEQGFYDDADDSTSDVGGDEETGYDASRATLDEHARDIYGLDNWDEVEAQWEREDANKQAELAAQQEAATAQQYGIDRLAEITQKVVHDSGLTDVSVPGVHEAAGKLLADRDWRRDHQHLEAEPLVAAALRDGLQALNVSQAKDENQALARYLLKMRAR
jgi:hypothetical protein